MLSRADTPTPEPVSLEEAKAYLRVTHDRDDVTIERFLIPAAREAVEGDTGRGLLRQSWVWTFDSWGGTSAVLEVPIPPLLEVTSIQYEDAAGVLQTLAPAAYVVSAFTGPKAPRGIIRPAVGSGWPTARRIVVTFVAGYGTEAAAVPAGLRLAVLAAVAQRYVQRGDQAALAASEAERQCAPFRVVTLA